MKSKEELSALRQRVEQLQKELAELSPEELNEVTGGYRQKVMELSPEELEKIAGGIDGDDDPPPAENGIFFVPVTVAVNANVAANFNAAANANAAANVNAVANANAAANANAVANVNVNYNG